MFDITKTKAGVLGDKLVSEINAEPSIVPHCDSVGTIDDQVTIRFETDPSAYDTEIDTVLSAHVPTPTPRTIKYPPVSLRHLNTNVTAVGSWQEVAEIVSKVDSVVSVLANANALVLGEYECDGGSGKYRLMAYKSGGAGTVEVIPPTALASTGGVAYPFVAITPVGNLPTGFARYVLEADLDSATSLELIGLSATPQELV